MSTELVGIELQLKGYEGVMSDMRALDQMLNSFRGKRNKINIESNLAERKKEVIALQGELNKLKQAKNILSEKGIKSEGLENKIKQVTERLREAQQAVREFQYALKNFSGMNFVQTFNKISSAVAHIGSAMQSAGNALTRMTGPFANFTKGIVMGAGYKALNKFTEGLTSGFSRSDTMRKYERLMKEYETANYTAKQSRQDLDQSVQGLPIALDEAVSLAQRYTLSLGDMERGTKLAIATNNAFLASMATENQRYQGMLQMQDLLNGKDLNSREWMSLGASMGKAINEIGKEFGYTNENMGEFRQELYAGHIATKDFLNALEKVGTGEGSLVELAKQSMDTWEAFFSRIGTAASRMVYGILTSMDELVSTASGGKFSSLNDLFDDYLIGRIDKMTESMKSWIKAHPDEIIEFGKSLANIKWGSILKGVAEGMQSVAEMVKSFADMFGGKDLSLIGRWMIKGNLLGNALTIFGGLLKGSRHIIGGLGAGGVTIFRTLRSIRKQGGLINWLGGVIVGDNAEKATETIDTVAKASPKMGKFSLGVSKIFKGWAEVATMIGGSAFVAWGSLKLFKGAFKSLKEIGDIVREINWSSATTAMLLAGDFIVAMIGVGKLIGNNPELMKDLGIGTLLTGALTLFGSGVFWADMAMIKKGFKAIKDATKYLNDAAANLNEIKSVSDVGGVKTKVKNAITLFNQIKALLGGQFDPVSREYDRGLEEIPSSVTKSMKNLTTIVTNMKTAVDTLNQLGDVEFDENKVSEIISKMQTVMSSLNSMIIAIPSILKTEDTAEGMGNLSSSISNVKSMFDVLIGKNGVLSQIPKVIKQIDTLSRTNRLDGLKDTMEHLGKALGEAYNALYNGGIGNGNFAVTNLNNVREALKQARLAIHHLNELGNVEVNMDGIQKIKDVVSELEKSLDDTAIDSIKVSVETFKQSIQDILKSIEDIGAEPVEIDAQVKLSSNFDSSVNAVVKDIKAARKKINDAWSTIPTFLRKTITLKLNARVDTSGLISGINTAKSAADNAVAQVRNMSSGGTVYRADGGSIFKPRGTDTVPAMLTPGEFVQNRHATDFWGVDFMRKVNAMDVRGAMQAMLTKAGNATNISRQSIVNHTINNNQRVNMTVNTDNPNFAGARMGRFVGAL